MDLKAFRHKRSHFFLLEKYPRNAFDGIKTRQIPYIGGVVEIRLDQPNEEWSNFLQIWQNPKSRRGSTQKRKTIFEDKHFRFLRNNGI